MADASKIIMSGGDSPETPLLGTSILYFKTDGLLYTKDDAGTETQVVDSGVFEIDVNNYIAPKTIQTIVPINNNEGTIGTTSKKWADVNATNINELVLTKQTVGFTIAGGTTSKTLTVANTASVSGTNTGDQDLSGYSLTSHTHSTYATQTDIIALSIALGG